MAIEFLDPTGNATSLWTRNSFSSIDDGVRQPTDANTGGDGNDVFSNTDDDNESQEYTFDTPINAGTCTGIKMWIFGVQNSGPALTVDVFANGSLLGSASAGLTAGFSWVSLEFTGLNINMADLTDLRSIMLTGAMGKADTIFVYAQYLELTYTPSAGPAGVIFSDDFNVGSDTLLQNRTPNIGTGWTKIIEVNAPANLEANAATNFCKDVENLVDQGSLYTANIIGDYPSANYQVELDYVDDDTSDDVWIMAIRIQDANNMYAVRFNRDASQLYKRVSGSWSTVGPSVGGILQGATAKLKIVGTTLSFFDDGVEISSETVTDHSAAGKAGNGIGAVILPGDDTSSQAIDNFIVTDLGEVVAAANFMMGCNF